MHIELFLNSIITNLQFFLASLYNEAYKENFLWSMTVLRNVGDNNE
jgi:hypothetical protein